MYNPKNKREKELNKLPKQLSIIQNEVMTGSLLGDGTINYKKVPTYNSLYKVLRQASDVKYLQWNADIFSNYCKDSPIKHRSYFDKRTQKE